MARANLSFCILSFLLCMVVCSCSIDSISDDGQKRLIPGTWCVANPKANKLQLQAVINDICSHPETKCGAIQSGGPCYKPNTVVDHASFALNLYYRANGATRTFCPNGFGLLTFIDPSYGSCKYP